MSLRVEITCNGKGCHTEPIYGHSIAHAYRTARRQGWTPAKGVDGERLDHCPQHKPARSTARIGECSVCGIEKRLNQTGAVRSHKEPPDGRRWRSRCDGSYAPPRKVVA